MFNNYGDVLSVFDAAEALNVGKNRVYALLASGKLKGFRMGHIWKISKQSLEEFITEETRKQAAGGKTARKSI